MLPIGNGADFKGVVNVLENKAYERTNKGEPKEIPVPADMADDIEVALEEITEAAAMSDDRADHEVPGRGNPQPQRKSLRASRSVCSAAPFLL